MANPSYSLKPIVTTIIGFLETQSTAAVANITQDPVALALIEVFQKCIAAEKEAEEASKKNRFYIYVSIMNKWENIVCHLNHHPRDLDWGALSRPNPHVAKVQQLVNSQLAALDPSTSKVVVWGAQTDNFGRSVEALEKVVTRCQTLFSIHNDYTSECGVQHHLEHLKRPVSYQRMDLTGGFLQRLARFEYDVVSASYSPKEALMKVNELFLEIIEQSEKRKVAVKDSNGQNVQSDLVISSNVGYTLGFTIQEYVDRLLAFKFKVKMFKSISEQDAEIRSDIAEVNVNLNRMINTLRLMHARHLFDCARPGGVICYTDVEKIVFYREDNSVFSETVIALPTTFDAISKMSMNTQVSTWDFPCHPTKSYGVRAMTLTKPIEK